MRLKRILQLIITAFLGQGLNVLTQLLVPPFFLRYYGAGVEVYGEWIALSASVNYLGTLNYGVQTYANNQMTILYARGMTREAKAIQASAFRLLLTFLTVFALIGLSVFVIPVASLLKLRHVGPHAAAVTEYLLILQIGVNMFFSLLTNSYMAVGRLHRGNYIGSGQRLLSILSIAIAVAMHSSFPVLAGLQLASLVLFTAYALIDLRQAEPVLVPGLREGSWAEVGRMIKPSGHFGLIAIAGFLTWQGPVIVIQRVLGPAMVTLFSLVRVVFQMSRQILSMASAVISQDITLLVGKSDFAELRRLYDLSERVVLFLIPVVSIGSLLMCPFLFRIWLHGRVAYQPVLCYEMAIVSAVLGLKEHKTQFQSSSNEHEKLSTRIVIGYSLMLAASVPIMTKYGVAGFIVTWLLWEIIQTAYVVRLNMQLFPAEHSIENGLLRRFTFFIVAAFALCALPAMREGAWPLWMSVGFALGFCLILAAAAYVVFQMDEIRVLLTSRFRRGTATTAV
jgi:O-antigen/teichoic acid export membrane protein